MHADDKRHFFGNDVAKIFHYYPMNPFLVIFLSVIRTRFILTQTHHPGNVGAVSFPSRYIWFLRIILNDFCCCLLLSFGTFFK